MGPFECFSIKPLTIFCLQNFILIAGAETRRTFAKDEERKYPGDAHPSVACLLAPVMLYWEQSENGNKLTTSQKPAASGIYTYIKHCVSATLDRMQAIVFICAVYSWLFSNTMPW